MTARHLKNDRAMTLDATATAMWEEEGKVGKPMSRASVLATERRALKKVKAALAKAGITWDQYVEYLRLADSVSKQVELNYVGPSYQ